MDLIGGRVAMEEALARWRSEKAAAYLSNAVARAEHDPAKAKLFRQMAEAAEEQAGLLAKGIGEIPPFQPSLRSRFTAFLIGIFGARAMRHVGLWLGAQGIAPRKGGEHEEKKRHQNQGMNRQGGHPAPHPPREKSGERLLPLAPSERGVKLALEFQAASTFGNNETRSSPFSAMAKRET